MNLAKEIVLVSIASMGGLYSTSVRAETTLDKVETKTKEVVYSIVDKSSYTVSFRNGKSALDAGTKNSLKALINSVKNDLTTGEIVVAAWSDHDFPANASVKISQADTELAHNRAENVSNYLKTLSDSTIVPMNMAEQNSLLSRLFSSDEDQVKQAIQTGTTDSRKVASIARVLKDKGGPGRVVVLVRKPLEIPNS